MAETAAGRGEAELREMFEAELRVAGLELSDGDRERLWVMWADYLPQREALWAHTPASEEEPTFIEKPTVGRGGA